jgi:hypothetical protein
MELYGIFNPLLKTLYELPSGKLTVCYGIDGPFIDGLPFLKIVIFYSYVKLPEGI